MKELAKLDRAFSGAEGRICLQYTDPLTGKVKEEIKGKNHVFTDQLLINDLRTALNYAALYLSDWAYPIRTDIAYVPGNILGYGQPGEGSLGTYRGAYRAADSFNFISDGTGGNLKRVYDFGPDQIKGDIKCMGLTDQMYNWPNSRSYSLLKQKTMHENSFDNKQYNKIYFPEEGISYSLTTGAANYPITQTTPTSLIVYRISDRTGDSEAIELENFLEKPLPEFFSGYTQALGYRYSDNTMWLLRPWCKRQNVDGKYVYTYYLEVYSFDRELTERKSYRRIQIPDGSLFDSETTSFCMVDGWGYTVNNNKIVGFDVTTDHLDAWGFRDLGGLTTDFQAKYCYANSMTVQGDVVAFGGNYRSGGTTSSSGGAAFLLDTSSKRVYALSAADQAYAPGRHMLGSQKVWLHKGDTQYPCAAYTVWKLPSDAPARPNGYGVTITYELEVGY